MDYDIIIIGGGPAGLTAGIYGARGGMSCAIFEKLYAGGQLANTDLIENYPGFAEGINGFDLSMQMQQQAERLGCKTINEEVTSIAKEDNAFLITTPQKTYTAKSVILTLGATPRKLGIEAEARFSGKGVSYCAVCDGALFRNKDVAVVGGGDTAIGDAVYLARFATSVTVIHRRDQLRAAKLLQDRAFSNPKIKFIFDSVVEDLQGEEYLETVRVKNVKTQEISEIKAAGLFVAVGLLPQNQIVNGLVDMDENGYIIADDHMRTSVKGLFAAGDGRQKHLRQVITAAADGAIAADSAIEYINNL